MTALVARTGRHQQRYEEGYRLVAGGRIPETPCKICVQNWRLRLCHRCIPYRYRGTDDNCNGNCERTLEVLMITSQSGPRLLFPKGGWENDETVEEAALREALEEAGVRGEIKGRLGSWKFKSKSHRDEYSPEGHCKAEMFALLVTEQLDSWPEQNARHRQWLTITEARERCRYVWMQEALDVCVATYTRLPSEVSQPVSPNGSSELSDEEQS